MKSHDSAHGYERKGPLRQRQKRLAPAQVAEMAARYAEGATVYELAAEFGVERTTVASRLKKAGVRMRRQSPTPEQVDEMVRRYEAGLSMAKVGECTGFNARTVLNHLRESGVQVRASHGRER